MTEGPTNDEPMPVELAAPDRYLVGSNWKCPHCRHAQVLSAKRFDQDWHRLQVEGGKSNTKIFLGAVSIVCANDDCLELSLNVQLGTERREADGNNIILTNKSWTLLPPSSAARIHPKANP